MLEALLSGLRVAVDRLDLLRGHLTARVQTTVAITPQSDVGLVLAQPHSPTSA